MRETINYKLKKPDPTEFFDMENHINYNADIIDAAIKGVKDVADSKAPSTHTHDAKDINGIKTDAKSIPIEDATNVFIATDVEGALLETKTSIVGLNNELKSVKQSASDGKTLVANAITGKGVPTLATDAFQIMATNISSIETLPPAYNTEKIGTVINSNININDAIVWQKYGNWETSIDPLMSQPTINVGVRNQIAFDKQGKFFAIVGESSPYVNIFKIENDVITKLPNPAVLPFNPCKLCTFSPDGKYLAVGGTGAVIMYSITGDVFTKVVSPMLNYADTMNSIKFSNDGQYFAHSGGYEYYFSIYRVKDDGTFGAIRTVTSNAYKGVLAFHPNSKQVLVSDSYNTMAYTLADGVSPIEGYTSGIKDIITAGIFSNNGDIYVTSSAAANRGLAIYTVSGNTFTEIVGAVDVQPTRGVDIVFSPDDNYLIIPTAISSGTSTFVYKRIGNTFKLINPITNPITYARYCAISGDNKYLAIQINTNATTIYRVQDKEIVMNYNIPNLSFIKLKDRYIGFATESKNIGEQVKVKLFTKFNIQ